MKESNLKIYQTKDYSLFKSIDGNRNKNLIHINRLKKSMQQNYLFTIIVVNENYEIIDGQHRFDVIKELQLPLNYIIIKGYGINEVHILNQNSKNWTSIDYLEGYCNLGMNDYIIFRDFIEYHKINSQIAMFLLGGYDNSDMIKTFNSGNFKVKNLHNAQEVMRKLQLLQPFYSGYKRRWFVYSIVRLLKKKEFNFTEFIRKLEIQPTALKDCIDINQYIALIEDIYNYRRKEKVSLKY